MRRSHLTPLISNLNMIVSTIPTSLWPKKRISSQPTTSLPPKSPCPTLLTSSGNVLIRLPSPLSTLPLPCSLHKDHVRVKLTRFSAKASASSSSVGSAEYVEEPATNVKFQTSLSLPGCSSPLTLLGTGYREKVFAIIGVKVYAVGLYINQSIISMLTACKGQTAAQIQEKSVIFNSIYQAPLEKTLMIVLVRDVDGKTFWDALDEAIPPRIKLPSPVDESALSAFRNIFQGRPLKKRSCIFLTWLDPSKMLVCVSSEGIPSAVDGTIESIDVTRALFDVFFGDDPVSPSLRSSVCNGLATCMLASSD